MKAIKRRVPLGAFAFLLVLALAAIGIVQGNWTQKLSIHGSVSTGSVSAEFRIRGGSQCPDNEFDRNLKDIGQTTRGATGKTFTVTLSHAYPNYEADCEVDFVYTGSVPGRVTGITVTPKGTNLTNCTTDDLGGGSFLFTCDQIQVEYSDGLCGLLQPHVPPQSVSASLIVTVLKGAPDNAKLAFNISETIVQWDKAQTCTT